uniref:Uncharacterized protein n=1 Tax=Rhizophora mucronata TaxID=61149 RepID=A0A2P2IU48_RHIMU
MLYAMFILGIISRPALAV